MKALPMKHIRMIHEVNEKENYTQPRKKGAFGSVNIAFGITKTHPGLLSRRQHSLHGPVDQQSQVGDGGQDPMPGLQLLGLLWRLDILEFRRNSRGCRRGEAGVGHLVLEGLGAPDGLPSA